MSTPNEQTIVVPEPLAVDPTPITITPPAATIPENPLVVPAPLLEPLPKTEPAVAEEEYDIEVEENSPLSQAELDSIAQYASKYSLSKEDAQAIVDTQEGLYSRGRTEVEARQTQEQETRRQALNTHPEFSGDKASDSWTSVSVAVQAFGTPELIAALNDPNKSGLDLSVALLLKNIGDQIRPETVPAGAGAHVPFYDKAKSEDEAKYRRLYPELFANEK